MFKVCCPKIINYRFKGDLLCFRLFFLSFTVNIFFCACRRSWNVKRSNFCSAGNSSCEVYETPELEVSPVILWLCDITLRHHVKHLHNLWHVRTDLQRQFATLYVHSIIIQKEMLKVLLHYIHLMLLMYQDLHTEDMITNMRHLHRLRYPAICNSVLY